MSRPGGLQRLAALLVAVAASVLLFGGGGLLLAGIADHQVEVFLDDWQQAASAGRPAPGERAWQVAHAAAERAVEVYPAVDGKRLERLGVVYSWQHYRQPYAAVRAEASRRSALAAYRAAVLARPTWPYAWAHLARTKLSLLEIDAEFAHALRQASVFGPWRPAINRELAEIGVMAWPGLGRDLRRLTLQALQRAAALGPAEAGRLIGIARDSGSWGQLCPALGQPFRVANGLGACPP